MPTESPSVGPSDNAGTPTLPPPASLKCLTCGAASLGPTDGVIYFGDTIERVCAACVRSEALTQTQGTSVDELTARLDRAIVIDLTRLQGARNGSRRCRGGSSVGSTPSPASSSTSLPPVPDEPEPVQPVVQPAEAAGSKSVDMPKSAQAVSEIGAQAKSVPPTRPQPWATAAPSISPSVTKPTIITEEVETPANPILEVGLVRQRSTSRGCLYPGSIFKGTQRSGRSAYEVEVRIADVNLDDWSLSGYLTIDNLTDSHPRLTTFFDGEIIGPKYGFITGQRFGATEVDDRRHWERFEQFLRPATKADIVRPEMLFRDPLPDKSRGETTSRERDFAFLRIKERFLVPDHRQRDISGASFAGEWV